MTGGSNGQGNRPLDRGEPLPELRSARGREAENVEGRYGRVYIEGSKPPPFKGDDASAMVLERLRWSAEEVFVSSRGAECWLEAAGKIKRTGAKTGKVREDGREWISIRSGRRPYSLAVIVTVHNRFEIGKRSVESLLASWLPPSNLVIIDDGSTDPRVKDWLASLDVRPHRLHLYRFERIGALWRILNRAFGILEDLEGIEYTAVCDNDFIYHPWWFLAGLCRFESIANRCGTKGSIKGDERGRRPGAFTAFHLGKDVERHKYKMTLDTPFGQASIIETGWLRNIVIPEKVRQETGPLNHDGDRAYILRMKKLGYAVVGTIPSYVQHISGSNSNYGHVDSDVSKDFIGERLAGKGRTKAGVEVPELSVPVFEINESSGERPGMWKIIHQEDGVVTGSEHYSPNDLPGAIRELSRSRGERHPMMVISAYGLGDALMIGPAIRGLHAKFPGTPMHFMCGIREHIMFLHDPRISMIVMGSWNPRMEDILSRFYHHVYRMGPWLTKNPDAFWKNGYDVACERLMVKPRSMLPEFVYTEEEEERVRKALKRRGLGPGRNRIVLMHGESSSMVRRWPQERILETAERLAAEGSSVIIASTQLYNDYRSPPVIDGIYFTGRDFADLSTRETLLLTKFADLVVAVDSVFSHMSAAFEKPSVLLYGAFDPLIRAKHFTSAHIIQSNVPCGPCHQHTGQCYLDEDQDVSRCMDAITVDEVVKMAEDVMEGKKEPDNLAAIDLDRIEIFPCPMCGSKASHFAWRKGDIFYYKCDSCSSLFHQERPDTEGLFTPHRRHWVDIAGSGGRMQIGGVLRHMLTVIDDLLPVDRKRTALDIGAGKGYLINMLRNSGWECAAWEPDKGAAGDLEEKGIENLADNPRGRSSVTAGRTYDAVFLMHNVTFVPDFEKLWESVDSCLAREGLLVISSPVADYASFNEAWPLNREEAGANLLVPSVRGLDIAVSSRGYEMVWRSKIRQRVSEIMIWKRTG